MMLAASQTEEDESMLLMARESMQALLESQTEMKLQDRKMVEKVNNLDEQIKKLTEEMTSSADRARKKQEERPLQNEKTSTIDDKIDTFFRALFSQINPKNKNRS